MSQPGARPLRNFDRVAEIYDATRGFPPSAEPEIGSRLAAIFRESAASPRVLEVGVGTGRVAVPLSRNGARVVGLDISRGMLEQLRQKGEKIDVLLAEATHPPFRATSFDGALFVHILHLVPDPEATIREALAAVRPGGVMVACQSERERTTAAASANDAIRRVVREVIGDHARHMPVPNARRTGLFKDVCAAAGLRLEERAITSWPEVTSARQELDELARQVHSHTWDIPADLLPEVVARATPEVAALMGGMDTPVEARVTFRATIGRVR